MLTHFTNLYPVWLILSAVIAFLYPSSFSWFDGPWINGALMTVMLGMGMTLTVEDFRRLLRAPAIVTFGFLAQYTIMPLAAWGIAMAMQLEAGFAVGLILLGSCPGGTASNVVTYLARADVALSVVLTMVSTLLAFIMTPLWCQMLAGQIVPVDGWGLCLSTFQLIVAPVVIGVFCNLFFPRQVERIVWLGPVLSVLAICFITGGIVSLSASAMASNAVQLTIAVLILHVVGFAVGYVITRVCGYSRNVARTVSIEVGMQNGGMAATLARNNFTAHPLAAVPAVFSAITQNILGSLLAAWWRFHPVPDTGVAVAPDNVALEPEMSSAS